MKIRIISGPLLVALTFVVVACGGGGGGGGGGNDGNSNPGATGTTEYPRSTRTFAATSYPGLTVGAGFALDSASAGQSVPAIVTDDTGDNLHGLSTNGTVTETTVRESTASSLSENGSEFDFGIEGRYLAFHGSVSGSHATNSQVATADYSFTYYKNEDHGLYAPKFPAATFQSLKQMYASDRAQFTRLYGTHYVSAVGLHRYVRATYYVSRVDTAKATSAGLSISAGGQWVAAGFNASGDLSSFLKNLSSKMSVSVYIETNADAVGLNRVITSPSDVDGVLAEIAAISYSGAKRVPYKYELTPWEDVFQGTAGTTNEQQALFARIARDYYGVDALAQSLEAVATDSVRFDYLGSQVRSYYSGKYAAATAERSRLGALLAAMKTNPLAGLGYTKADLAVQFLVPGSVTFDPYLDNHHFLKVTAYVKGAIGTYHAVLTNGSVVIPQDDADSHDLTTGTLPSDNVRFIRFQKDYPSYHPMWNVELNRVDGTGWYFQLRDVQDKTVLSAPMPIR